MAKNMQAANVCILSGQTSIHGDIVTAFDVHVDAIVHGNIQAGGKVVISSKAEVYGNVQGEAISVAGKIQGDVRAATSLHCLGTANMVGQLYCKRFHVEEGALLHGSILMDETRIGHEVKTRVEPAKPLPKENSLVEVQQEVAIRAEALPKATDTAPSDETKDAEKASVRNFKLNMNLW
ncbi:MAG: bactofilin family protein [Nitritalea sp.]